MLENPRQGLKVQAEKRIGSVLNVLNRQWFDGRFQSSSAVSEQAMVLLLLNVYAAMTKGKPLTKSSAMKAMRLRHARSSAPVIEKAITEGLIRIKVPPDDKRSTLLFPTPRLERMIEDEMSKIDF